MTPVPYDRPAQAASSFSPERWTDDIRAFDVSDGRLLREDPLPAGGQSTPMTYEARGKQYVVTVDGGHSSFGTRLGDHVRAYAGP